MKIYNLKKNTIAHKERSSKAQRAYLCIALAVMCVCVLAVPVLAATGGAPLESINKLSEFVFACIKAIGVLLLGFGIVQLGLSLKGHDPAQRANGLLCIFGGLLIAFSKEILDMII